MGHRRIPQRTCIVCRRVGDKRDLVRIVRTPDRGVLIDLKGKQNGRGAYLCRACGCWERALADSFRLLERALKTTLTEGERDDLLGFMETLTAEGEASVAPDALAIDSLG